MPLRYEQFSPHGELHRWVECYWRLTGEAGLAPHPQRILPDGYVEIILHLGDPFLRVDEGTTAVRQARTLFAGQMIRPVRVMATGRTCVWGIRLHPWAAAAVAGMPASELTDRIEDAEAVAPQLVKALRCALADAMADAIDDERQIPPQMPPGSTVTVTATASATAAATATATATAAASCVRALDQILMRHLMRAAPIDPLVMAAGRLLLREPRPIADVARRMGVSPRHLSRTFRHVVGLTPKMFARISRFQRVAAVLDDDGPGGGGLAGVALAGVALDCGYYDQSHLVRDVRAFAGGTPVALRAALDGELAEYFLRARRASHFSKIDPPALD
jgi:AraC-like DNA-binding protein